MTKDNCRSSNNHGNSFDSTIVVPSPGSIWDYPYMDEVGSMMSTVPVHVQIQVPVPIANPQSFFPPKRRTPRTTHMETPIGARFGPTRTTKTSETELSEVRLGEPKSVATSTSLQITETPCRNGGCKTWRNRVETHTESPWHVLKTIFLVSVIAALVLWVIVYTLLVQYQIL